MKNIKRNYFVSILAVCLLVSFTPPLKKKKVEVKPIATYLPMGGGIIMPRPSATLGGRGQGSSLGERSQVSMLSEQIQASSLPERSRGEAMPTTTNGDSTAKAILPSLGTTNDAIIDDEIIGKNILPIKPLPVSNRVTIFKLPKITQNIEPPTPQKEYYKYDSTSKSFLPVTSTNKKEASIDPLRFTITSNKNSVAVGEELELTIKVELLNISPQLLFTFEELRSYTLKVVTPEGFIQTGGNYYDFVNGRLEEGDAAKEYKLRGRFENIGKNNCFALLRGQYDANEKVYFKKGEYCINYTEANKTVSKIKENDAPTINKKTNIPKKQVNDKLIVRSDTDPENECYGFDFNVSVSNRTLTYSISNLGDDGLKSPGAYYIDFGDGNSSSSSGGTHIYTDNGNYNVSGTVNFTSCSSTAFASIDANCPGVSTPTISGTNSACSSESVTLTAEGCASNETILWSNNAPLATISGLAGGSYSVKCRNVCGVLSVSSETFTVLNLGSRVLAPSLTTPNGDTVCGNGTTDAKSIDVSTCSGAKVVWNDGFESYSLTRRIYISDGTPTSITYSAKCQGGCNTSGSSDDITVYRSELTNKPTLTAVKSTICINETTSLNVGSCDNSGTIEWENEPSNTGAVGAGTYKVRCKNSCNTTAYEEVTITLNENTPSPTAIDGSTKVCPNNSVTFTDTGCPAGSSLSWKDGDNIVSYDDANIPGGYTIHATCTDDCSGKKAQSNSKTVTISSDANTPSIDPDKYSICGDGIATITATGCNGTVFWNDNENWTGTSIAVGVGTYTAKCKTECSTSPASNEITISSSSTVITSINFAYENNSACGASFTDLNAWSSSDPNGTDYTYKWYNENDTNNSISTGRSLRVYNNNKYYVKAFKSGLCTTTRDANAAMAAKPAAPTLTPSVSTACPGSSVSITSSCTGTTNFSTPLPFTMGTSTVSVYASCTVGSCTSDNSTPTTIDPATAPTALPAISATNRIICSQDGSVPLSVTCESGTTPLWSTGETTGTINASAVGIYTVLCRNGCLQNSPTSAGVSVTKDPTTPPSITTNKTVVCGTEQATLTATGCGGTVKWSNSTSGTSANVGAGVYTAICNTTCGDSSPSEPKTITIPNAPSLPSVSVIPANLKICDVNGSATLTATCATGKPIWWDDARIATKTVNETGTYNVQCISTCNVRSLVVPTTITKDPAVAPVLDARITSICGDETAAITATGCGGSVVWSTGQTAASITVSNAGNYTAICRTTCGDSPPSNQVPIQKNVPPVAPSLTSQAGRTTVCFGGQNVVLVATGGCSAANVVWFGSNDGGEVLSRMNTNGTLTIDNNSFTQGNMTFRAICQTNCGESNNSNTITITKSNITATANSNSPNGEIDEFTNDLNLTGNSPAGFPNFAWAGPNGFTSNLQNPTILAANLSAAYSGVYTLTVSVAGGCYTTATTSVVIDPVTLACENYYLKSYYSTPSVEETTKLRRIGTTNTFEPISMALEVLDGATTLGINYQWTAPAGVSLSPNTTAAIVNTSKIGNYKLTLTRGSSTCELYTDISGKPCTEATPGTFACSNAFTPPTPVSNEVPNLAVGDEFYAADYKFTVTRVDAGSLANGWTGEATGTLRIVNGFEVKIIPVEFILLWTKIVQKKTWQ